MNNRRTLVTIACILVGLSIVFYLIHYAIFQDAHHIFIYLLGDIAFLPLEVLLVGIVIERILEKRKVEEKIQKLNMVIGAFFSEVGRPFATLLLKGTENHALIVANMNIKSNWTARDYKKAKLFIEKNDSISFNEIDLDKLKTFFSNKRDFLLTLIENPNLLEHERFTDLLLATFHVMEELESRPGFETSTPNDLIHISIDIKRAFQHLAVEWLDYLQHLKVDYPFLYSHYLRINPFQDNPSAIIE
jgi:hypothetical protein